MTIVAWFRSFISSIYDEFFGEPVSHPIIRRVLAFAVDAFLFFALASLIALIQNLTDLYIDIFYLLGLHLIVCALYFSVFDSKIGHGKTLGKRIFKLKVVDENGAYISFARSLLRSLPLILILNSYQIAWTLHLADVEFIHIMFGLYIFLIGIVYFSIAKLNRQGLHDLIVGTQVVSMNETISTRKNLSIGLVSGFVLLVLIVLYQFYFLTS